MAKKKRSKKTAKKTARKTTKRTVKKPVVKSCEPCLSVRGFALAGGLLWGFGVLFLGLAALYVDGWGQAIVNLLDSIYVGYEATPIGSLIGGVWGFIDGFIGSAVFAWLYNMFK